MHFFVTGHTGFKGSWLILLLKELGHEVSGYALDAEPGSLFNQANLVSLLNRHYVSDIRDYKSLSFALSSTKPDFVIHLAAQSLVLKSYLSPIETYTTNVDGTRNLLQAIQEGHKPKVTLVVTTDKVYADTGKGSYKESDSLGGHDPYSTSKAMADLLTQSWSAINPDLRIRIARAGNVIGAFDTSKNRLISDATRAIQSRKSLEIRNPRSIRPWQHVLDCLAGYLMYVFETEKDPTVPIALNFGPDSQNFKSVMEVIKTIKFTHPDLQYHIREERDKPRETEFLTLDSRMAISRLGWSNSLSFDSAVRLSVIGPSQTGVRSAVLSQIRNYLSHSQLR
jgi:CDP-glucose 4,6-dehydratase